MSAEKKAAKAVRAVERLTDHETVVWNALMLASAGIYVFPVLLTDPVPKATGGVKATKRYPVKWGTEASIDPDKVADLFERNPHAAVGIATGPSRLIALDLDRSTRTIENEETGQKADVVVDGWNSLAVWQLKPPETPLSWPTLGGGEHLVYRSPENRYAKTLQDLPYETADDGTVPLTGVDVRATGGMLVYYGPRIEAKPDLDAVPIAPEWMIHDAAPTGAKTAPDLAFDEWFAALRKGKPGPRVVEALKAFKREGMTHGDLLVATNRLAELAAQGATGIRKAVLEARERYTSRYPSYGKAFDDAMLDAAQYYGKPLPILATVAAPKPEKSSPTAPEPDIEEESAPRLPILYGPDRNAPVERVNAPVVVLKEVKRKKLPPAVPDDFVEPRTGLNSDRLGLYANEDGRIGVSDSGLFWEYRGGVWRPNDNIVRDRVVHLLRERYRRDHVNVARDMIAADPDTFRITGEPHEAFINVKNGMLDWRRGKLHPHSAAYLSTVQLNVSYTPGAEHPLFDKWLELVSGDDPDMAVTIWELIAYAVYNGNPFQRAALLHGVANGGKSVFIRLLETIVGPANVAHLTPEQMEERFGPSALLGKALNTQGEYEGKRLRTTAGFKSIVAGDEIQTEMKNKPQFSFRPWAFHVFATNEFDLTSDTTEGYYRRWIVLTFTKAIRHLVTWTEAEFFAEADAIFSDAVTRLPELLAQGHFTETLHTMKSAAEMRRDSDTVALWLTDDEHVTIADPSSPVHTRRSHVYQTYRRWAESNGHRPMSNQSLYKRLERLGYFAFKASDWRIRGIEVDTVPLTDGGRMLHDADDERGGR